MMQYMKRAAKALFHQLGYEIRAVQQPTNNVDFLAALDVKESQYYTQWSAPCPLFTPWVGHPDFQKVYDGAAPHTIVSPDRCYILISFARYASHLVGDFAECGVYTGGTALLLARIIQDTKKTLYLFDSFEGLPKSDSEKDKWFHEGQFAVDSVEKVKAVLQDFLPMVDIRKGWIPETFAGLEKKSYAFAHIDIDLYQSALDCCKYFYPRLAPGGVLLFDEYGFAAARGEKDAVDEFLSDKPESPISLPTGQAVVIKLPPA